MSKKNVFAVENGSPHPLGASLDEKGVNFSVFSSNATEVSLLIFKDHDSPEPLQVIELNPQKNKTFHFWHIYLKGLKHGIHYAYRVNGPSDLSSGNRFNPQKLLLDPYAFGNTNNLWKRGDACGDKDNLKTSMRSVVIDTSDYDWEDDKPLSNSMSDSIIYEMHTAGFTKSPTSKVKNPGTFSAVIEKIPYLKDLGITAVELLPVMQFDENSIMAKDPDGNPLKNYWGYSTVSFFAPHPGYCITPEEGQHINEFRDMVKALHKAGIEVILDVVFNHTDEGNHQGPVFSKKGFDNSIYYHLVEHDKQYYMDYTGCGNTVNCNHPIVEKFILECLEFWVREMHVDGFRFDEGTILSRGPDGNLMEFPPVLWNIELSETLADSKIIAEAWDAGGLYEVGSFPGYRWSEWNGKFRDDIRSFVRGDKGIIRDVAGRISGSPDIYSYSKHLPVNSINFITCHDGFTMNDLVSYNRKHNNDNGENNNDGISNNLSWNCGFEGETEDPDIENLRLRQIKNLAAILLLSKGVPMILGGDEIRRTQKGNNNAYCQDNEISWFDWELAEKNKDLFRFYRLMIAFRKANSILHQGASFFDGSINKRGLKDIAWHGCELNNPGWDDPEGRVLAFTIGGIGDEPDLHIMMNMYWEALPFQIPKVKGRKWFRAIDTFIPSPDDISESGSEILINDPSYIVNGRSIVVLISI